MNKEQYAMESYTNSLQACVVLVVTAGCKGASCRFRGDSCTEGTCLTLAFSAVQEHAERPHVVQRLISEAHLLVQSAQHLEVRLDKDITKLQVCPPCYMPAHLFSTLPGAAAYVVVQKNGPAN